MSYGKNLADPVNRIVRILKSIGESNSEKNTCVFISHQHEDISECEILAEYLMNAGIDVYLDKYDAELGQAVQLGDPNQITKRLREGIDNSTHMICVVSKKTIKSYWVPFEVGYGYRSIVLGILTLKGIKDDELPDYMKTTSVIRGTKSLNDFISILIGMTKDFLEERRIIKSHIISRHPLDEILDWNQ